MRLLWCLNTFEMVYIQRKQKHRLLEREGELELVVVRMHVSFLHPPVWEPSNIKEWGMAFLAGKQLSVRSL